MAVVQLYPFNYLFNYIAGAYAIFPIASQQLIDSHARLLHMCLAFTFQNLWTLLLITYWQDWRFYSYSGLWPKLRVDCHISYKFVIKIGDVISSVSILDDGTGH